MWSLSDCMEMDRSSMMAKKQDCRYGEMHFLDIGIGALLLPMSCQVNSLA